MINKIDEYISLDSNQAEQFIASNIAIKNSFEIISDSIIGTDDKFRITLWNNASENLYGWKAEEVLGRKFSDIIQSEITEEQRKAAYQRVRELNEFTHEVTHRDREGKRIIVESKTTAVRDGSGRLIGYVSVNRNITKRKEREKQLLHEKRKAEFLLELSERIVEVINDYDSVLKKISQGVAEIIGETCIIKLISDCGNYLTPASYYTASKEMIEPLSKMFELSFQIPVHRSLHNSIIKTGKPLFLPVVDHNYFPISKNHKHQNYFDHKCISSYISVPLRAQGKIIGVISLSKNSPEKPYTKDDLSFIEQIAGKISPVISCSKLYNEKLLEIEERKKAEVKLAENESLLNSILETIPVGLWVSNENGEFLRGNDKAFEIWSGNSDQENQTLKRISSFWAGKGSDKENEKITAIKKDLTEKQKNDTMDIILSDGTLKTINSSALPIYNTDGRITGAVVVNQDITEVREFENQLIKSEERFHMLADNMSQCVWMADENGNRFWFNKRWYDYTGTTSEEMLGGGWQKVHHPDHFFQAINKLQESLITGQPWEDTVLLRGKDGEYRWFLGRALPVYDENGNITHWFGTNTDITEQKRYEEKLKETLEKLRDSESRLAEAQSLAKAGSYSLYIKDYSLEWSREMFNIFGKDPSEKAPSFEEVTGMIHSDDLHVVNSGLKETLTNKIAFEVEYRIVLKEGRIKYLYTKAIPEMDASGNVSRLFGATMDITERKSYQLLLEKGQEDLKEAQRLAHVGSFTVDYENNAYVQWSDEILRIYGWDRNNGNPTREDSYRIIHPDDLEHVMEIIQSSKDERKKTEDDFRIITADNKIKYIHCIFSPEYNNTGKLTRFLGTAHDITESMLQQEKIKETLQKLEHSNKELEQFAYVASHDLQEPLRMISSYLKLLEQKYKLHLDDKAKMYINYAVDGSKRMSNLIRDLLAYSRVVSQAKEFEMANLNSVYSTVISDLQVLIKETGARIFSEDLPDVCCDKNQISQLLQNLIGNAIKFHGSNPPEVTIKKKKTKNGWLFEVKDNGIGIDPEYHERIFQIFQRLHERDKYPGTGIGLALCKKIVECHGGRIWLESEVGKGSTFYFTIH